MKFREINNFFLVKDKSQNFQVSFILILLGWGAIWLPCTDHRPSLRNMRAKFQWGAEAGLGGKVLTGFHSSPFYKPRLTCLGMVVPTVGRVLPTSIRNHENALPMYHRPILRKLCFNWTSLFPADSNLCWCEKNWPHRVLMIYNVGSHCAADSLRGRFQHTLLGPVL